MSDVREIVHEYLVAHGYDGLVHDDGTWDSCGCGLDDLNACDGPCFQCQPAYHITWDTCPFRAEDDCDCEATRPEDCFGCYTMRKPKEATDETR